MMSPLRFMVALMLGCILVFFGLDVFRAVFEVCQWFIDVVSHDLRYLSVFLVLSMMIFTYKSSIKRGKKSQHSNSVSNRLQDQNLSIVDKYIRENPQPKQGKTEVKPSACDRLYNQGLAGIDIREKPWPKQSATRVDEKKTLSFARQQDVTPEMLQLPLFTVTGVDGHTCELVADSVASNPSNANGTSIHEKAVRGTKSHANMKQRHGRKSLIDIDVKTQQFFASLSDIIESHEWIHIGLELGIDNAKLRHFDKDSQGKTAPAIRDMLISWWEKRFKPAQFDSLVEELRNAFNESGRQDLVGRVSNELAPLKFQNSELEKACLTPKKASLLAVPTPNLEI